MDTTLTLTTELRKIVESQIDQVIKGIEHTFSRIIETHKITPTDLKDELDSLEETFNLLFQKWSLEILYTLQLKNSIGFSEIKKILCVNSRTLSDKLKMLQKHGYITRTVTVGPPLRVEYALTSKGKNTVLLALPLLYYSSAT
ncbi:MAG: helix-turn-helix domain-containing protein [Candidatus Bathyarchaeota archaeon]|mgnify:CR=1 FL=1|nr:helix-turn-helix domain-containing protein [Candidatus Bathyarchaeota archaeon]MDD4325135.1 helix-turn-helix domain-containing protein [Candidatus Bathyarchaeota archaeon]MDI9578235.1 helix-turn-helix domain-containing protein [Thermoproteota archaeon]MDT8782082.1 helix-turn-helix transcriptional regulator [Candidatus Bathyarchaeota archaeon]NLD65967.1 helix-turn-helix transcriptional regulator [Thermoproteota archaeon]